MINAVEFVFLFALGAGLLVLYAALVATEDERRREAAVMRVYGASRAHVTGSQRAEFLAMGLVAGVLATLGAAVIGQSRDRRDPHCSQGQRGRESGAHRVAVGKHVPADHDRGGGQ